MQTLPPEILSTHKKTFKDQGYVIFDAGIMQEAGLSFSHVVEEVNRNTDLGFVKKEHFHALASARRWENRQSALFSREAELVSGSTDIEYSDEAIAELSQFVAYCLEVSGMNPAEIALSLELIVQTHEVERDLGAHKDQWCSVGVFECIGEWVLDNPILFFSQPAFGFLILENEGFQGGTMRVHTVDPGTPRRTAKEPFYPVDKWDVELEREALNGYFINQKGENIVAHGCERYQYKEGHNGGNSWMIMLRFHFARRLSDPVKDMLKELRKLPWNDMLERVNTTESIQGLIWRNLKHSIDELFGAYQNDLGMKLEPFELKAMEEILVKYQEFETAHPLEGEW